MSYTTTQILESCKDNNGERTVLRTVLEPYATALPHVHTQFTELFYVEAGELDVWNGFGKVHLELAQAVGIERNTVHHYVAGKTGAILTITLEPGSTDVEKAIQIMQGIQHDGTYVQLNTAEGSRLIFSTLMAQLTDSNPVGDAKEQMEALLNSEESYRVESLKRELLDTYCS
jgi:quercetin dioxygenase-like cupin family protein